ncbi:MAG TPA: glutamate cyclase domain-containing protein [Rugosimonospora sp.]|jgi:hypothetical protein
MPTMPPARPAGVPPGEVLDRSVGENLDRLITIDMRGDEIGRVIYQAARARSPLPLTLAGARFLRDQLAGGTSTSGVALFLTGFRIPPTGVPETDGLIGSAVLAHALDRAGGTVPVFVCEPEVTPALAAALRATGLAVADRLETAREMPHTAAILSWPDPTDTVRPDQDGGSGTGGASATTETAALLAAEIAPAVCVAIERPGRNAKGQYHFAGGINVSAAIAPIDSLYEAVAGRGAGTLAIGDFGNELGMGAIADTVKAETPAGGDCACGCGGGTACEIPADITIACTVSDWGAYALAAALSHLYADPGVLVSAAVYRRILEATVAAGAIDGTSRLAVPHVDGVGDEYNGRLLEMLRDAVAYPNRPHLNNAMRRYRGSRIEGV